MRIQRVKANALAIEAREREERLVQQQAQEERQHLSAPASNETALPTSEPTASPWKTFTPGSDQPESWAPQRTIRRGS